MANFSTNMKEWDGGYAPVSPITAKKSDPWGELAAKIVPGLLDAAGKGYAQAKGANILGMDTTAEEAQQAVTDFDKIAPFTQDESNTPDQKAQVDDMKAAALRKFGTNDKKIQALVSAGKISSLEANARRHQMIQENLSNPVLAMFKDEFMEASTAFTGGPGLTERYFGAYMPTDAEKAQLLMIDKKIEEEVKFNTIVESTALNFGVDIPTATVMVRASQKSAAEVAELETQHKIRGFKSGEAFDAGMKLVNDYSQQVGGQIAALAASGQKIDDPAVMLGQVKKATESYRQRLSQFASSMTREDYLAAEAELVRREKGIQDIISSADGMEFFKRNIQKVTMSADAAMASSQMRLLSAIGDMYTLHKFSPTLADNVDRAALGAMDAKYFLKLSPTAQKALKYVGYAPDDKKLAEHTNQLLTQGADSMDKKSIFNVISSWWGGGDSGVKAEMEIAVAAPDEHVKALQSQFNDPNMDLSYYATSSEAKAAAKTKDGAKMVANAFKARMASVRSRQPEIPKGEVRVEIENPPLLSRGGLMPSPKVKFNVEGLSESVRSDLSYMTLILRESPLVMKELGVSTPEEWINNHYFK